MSASNSSHHSQDRKRGSASSSKLTTSSKTTVTKDTKNSRPKDANYQQKLIDGGIYPYGYKFPDGSKPPLPPDWEELNRRLAEARASLSPSRFSDGKYQEFIEEDAGAFNEDAVKDSVLPAMLRAIGASRGAQKNILFTNTEPIVAGISQAKPDYYYGAPPELIDPDIRQDERLKKHIIPSSHAHLPAVPNFSLEAKGPDGSLAEALRQACHNGAVGERAMHSLETYGKDEPVYDGTAHTISSIFHGGTLKMYGHSVAPPNGPRTRPEYYMHQLGAYAMTHTNSSFRDGATAFKNALDWTTEHRNAAIDHANSIVERNEDEADEIENESQAGEEQEENDEEDTEEEDTDEDETDANPLNTMASFDDDRTTSAILSARSQDEDAAGSDTSVEDVHKLLPSKRPLTESHRSYRSHKRKPGTSSSRQSHSNTKSGVLKGKKRLA
jgi:hypothetical protein